MLPTLNGRIQTRIFLLVVVGGLWTLLITPLLPGVGDLGEGYRNSFIVLLTVIVLGVLWEFIYHGIQQFRWEKDWPTLFGLVTGINEGLLVFVLLTAGLIPRVSTVSYAAFVILFSTIWLITWLAANGPMRVPFIRWRFRGGRLI
jgi:hypothetical protein